MGQEAKQVCGKGRETRGRERYEHETEGLENSLKNLVGLVTVRAEVEWKKQLSATICTRCKCSSSLVIGLRCC